MSRIYRNDSITTLEYTEETKRSLYSMFTYSVSHAGESANAVQYFGNHISYGELKRLIDECAAGLIRIGVKKGDYVTIFLPNIPQCVIAVYAVNRIGAICNLVHPLSTKNEIEYAVGLTNSRFILTFELNEGICSRLKARIIRCRTPEYFPKNPKGFMMKTVYNHSVRKSKRADYTIEWSEVMKRGRGYLKNNNLPEDTVKADDIAAIMYTGGTTGPSKGAMMSNSAVNYVTIQLLMPKINGTPHIGDAFLSVLPVFHAFGLAVVIHAPLSSGMRAILSPRFNVKECSGLILKEKIAVIAGVPAMYERMYPLLKGKDLSFVRYIVSGGDKVSSDLVERYNKILDGHTQFLPGYGLTEACGACMLTEEGYKEFEEGCVGVPLEGTQVCIVSPGTTEVLNETEEGELCIIGPSLMRGYFKDEKASADVLRKHDDGKIWLHTGDIVRFGKGRNIIFRSRYKRLVKVNGFNVYPTLIENTIEKCPLVKEVCAVGVPWKTDTRIKLYVTLNEDSDRTAKSEKIMEFAKSNLNHWSCPFEVEVLNEMPLTKMNKTDYRVLEKRG
ncbi:MAG: class I adenylate-forming enzyme family protein [Methanocorpusculum sp.]|nr:class I adenylate-forming enzyme family protein [Methanocorpusculum sp.]